MKAIVATVVLLLAVTAQAASVDMLRSRLRMQQLPSTGSASSISSGATLGSSMSSADASMSSLGTGSDAMPSATSFGSESSLGSSSGSGSVSMADESSFEATELTDGSSSGSSSGSDSGSAESAIALKDCSGGDSACSTGSASVRIVRSIPNEGRVKYLDGNANLLGGSSGLVKDAALLLDTKDPYIKEMQQKLSEVLAGMERDRKWIDAVRNVVRHYQAKVASVKMGLRSAAQSALAIKHSILKKNRFNRQQALKQKMREVRAQMDFLQRTASTVNVHQDSIASERSRLQRAIKQIQNEIERMQTEAPVPN